MSIFFFQLIHRLNPFIVENITNICQLKMLSFLEKEILI